MIDKCPILTIGHSNHTTEKFIGLLREHSVTALADVRSSPFSRFNPQFNKDILRRHLEPHGIKYVFLGRELGARSSDASCYENGRVQYERLASTALYREGLDRLTRGLHSFHIALMCAEKEPLACHRTLLVANSLVGRGLEVAHILADGTLEPHDKTMVRLLDLVGLPQKDLFRTRSELIEEARALQEARIAYVDESLAVDAKGDVA